MRYKAYISSAKKVAIAEYREGFKPESDTYPTREEALAALAQRLADELKEAQIQYQLVNSWSVDTIHE